MRKDVLAYTLVAATAPIGFQNGYMPSIMEVKMVSPDQTAALRAGYGPALGLSLALGLGLSFLAKSPIPLLASAASSAYMVHSYEMALPAGSRLGDPVARLMGVPAAQPSIAPFSDAGRSWLADRTLPL